MTTPAFNEIAHPRGEAGKFTTKAHTESAVTLVPTRKPDYVAPYSGNFVLQGPSTELPPYPSNLPEPSVYFEQSDGKINTWIAIDDETKRFWTDDLDGTLDSSCQGEDPWEELDYDEEDLEAATEWARAVHERVDCAIYGATGDVIHQAPVHDAILAYATGGPAPAGMPDIDDPIQRGHYLAAMRDEVHRLKLGLESATLVTVAEEVLRDVPDADSFTFHDDNESWVGAAWDADGNELEPGLVESINHVFDKHLRYDELDTYRFEADGNPIRIRDAARFRP
ncbi:hypothetical protein [Arthrobacter sp. A2-55]|uniref:hypothetical protein n=1 Tax=Arthrobacter sp. A2-55 TaxID=2897337 RepID=UPI0021CDB247|nr:hypothetical protein [Arthrobacter sp. A2-55]MCU6480169.1 hypothetical protein [Arthrobacter sp. A2-55]